MPTSAEQQSFKRSNRRDQWATGDDSLLAEHLPHQRALCPLHPFHAAERPIAAPVDGNEATCPNCYCLICDARVSECRHWRGGDAPAHCNAHSNSVLWRQKRVNAKRQRTRAVRAAQRKRGGVTFSVR
ncbi:hypothetical protein EMIHUDRAFT_227051 [Emiliania huxleyi CCMP1516]|uniref:B box-type domain-containing protein n=2 Tax=Emiliania huxleyi TaxID=2903 RepID=A0A0D3KJK6_EMIH1|nr:hypothetical protein EMIHUDRAFT_227051 [Emiliania huxleyi CCMP1516]EOD35941.1 hypothetical protein EMIHUDRAFT_227051 [Emiliania huxleyi CCMP1516]|eukprot:XP_005788370.1 hypothetical protein EMIHUDRAFT_227051 [Emiliania huxleyi CCMP1516]